MIKKFGINKDIGNADVEVYLKGKLKDSVFHIDERMTDIRRAKKLVRSLRKAIEYVENKNHETSRGEKNV